MSIPLHIYSDHFEKDYPFSNIITSRSDIISVEICRNSSKYIGNYLNFAGDLNELH